MEKDKMDTPRESPRETKSPEESADGCRARRQWRVHIRPTDGGRRLGGKLRGHAAGRWGTIGRRWWARQCTRPRGCVSATALSCSELFPVPGQPPRQRGCRCARAGEDDEGGRDDR